MNTTRRGFLHVSAGLMAAGLAHRLAFAADSDHHQKPADTHGGVTTAKASEWFSGPINVTKIDAGLLFLEGAGGNSVAMIDDDRVFLIDSGVPKRGADLLALVSKLAPTAVIKTLFNTHWHFDHVGGNIDFAKAGFTIIGSTTCRARLAQKIVFEDLGRTTEPTPEHARPSITFDDKLRLHELSTIVITRIAPAHTDTDAIAFFEKPNVLHTGDLLFTGMFPVIDRSTGGSLDGMIASSKLLHSICDDKTRVVPGHGPMSDRAPLKAQHELLLQVRDRLAPYGEKRKTMDEVLAAKPLADLDEKWGKGFLQSPVFTKMAYGQWLKR